MPINILHVNYRHVVCSSAYIKTYMYIYVHRSKSKICVHHNTYKTCTTKYMHGKPVMEMISICQRKAFIPHLLILNETKHSSSCQVSSANLLISWMACIGFYSIHSFQLSWSKLSHCLFVIFLLMLSHNTLNSFTATTESIADRAHDFAPVRSLRTHLVCHNQHSLSLLC